ncbi:MAG: PHP domain-containing protein [Verrucomicrobia bacterium]|nr:PHP domain-containing protein [Verrucomicrobiota bacterium]
MFRADLHCHTTFSDGTMTPQQILLHAKEIGLSGISITDHDTIEAYTAAPAIAKELGLAMGSGVEFSSVFRTLSVHILGYDFDLKSPEIQKLCDRHQQRRRERNKRILDKLSRLSMPILEEELLSMGERTVGRPHIAQLMIKKGYVSTIKQAFNLYIGDGRPCFDPGEGVSSEETIEVIHQGGGKAFLAHPHLLEHASKIKELLKLPFDGIECHYARFAPDQEKRWIKVAKEKGWLMSGGSDFHGTVKDYIQLGCSWVDEETFHQIFQKTI